MTDMNIMELILNFFIRNHEVPAEHLLKIRGCLITNVKTRVQYHEVVYVMKRGSIAVAM